LPELTQTILASANRYLLPASDGGKQPMSGKMLQGSRNKLFQVVISLGKTAGHELNE
jgi:hypothetical protein